MVKNTNDFFVVSIDHADYLMPAKDAELIMKAMMNAVSLELNFKALDYEWFIGKNVAVSIRRVLPGQIKQRKDVESSHSECHRQLLSP
jgi:hypothetical protein